MICEWGGRWCSIWVNGLMHVFKSTSTCNVRWNEPVSNNKIVHSSINGTISFVMCVRRVVVEWVQRCDQLLSHSVFVRPIFFFRMMERRTTNQMVWHRLNATPNTTTTIRLIISWREIPTIPATMDTFDPCYIFNKLKIQEMQETTLLSSETFWKWLQMSDDLLKWWAMSSSSSLLRVCSSILKIIWTGFIFLL